MSLINKALKQEQRRRAMGNMSGAIPPAFGASSARAAYHRDSKNTIILIGLLAVGLLLIASTGTFVYFGSRYLDQVADADGNPAQAEPDAIAPSAVAAHSVPTEAPPPSSSAPPSAAAAPPAESQVPTPAPRHESSAAPSEADAAPSALHAPPGIDIETQLFLESLQILGVRSAGAESRLLIAGRVYKLEDVIDHRYGVKFVGADGETIYFEDERGARYERPQ